MNMPVWMQHALVIALVAGCALFVAWQGFRSLAGKTSRVGSCCAKGCGGETSDGAVLAKPQAAPRDQFMPVAMLQRRR